MNAEHAPSSQWPTNAFSATMPRPNEAFTSTTAREARRESPSVGEKRTPHQISAATP